MKKFLYIFFIAVFVFGFSYVLAKSENANQGADNQNQNQNQEQNQGEEIQNQNQNQEQEQEQEQEQGIENEELPGKNGQINAEQHRSTVADFVQNLLKVASRSEGGIGEQVRLIAQEQNQAEETTIRAIERVQTRSNIRTFLFGSDYKNLGQLRSEMVKTRSRIEQLNRIMEQVENSADETELQNQIQTLEQERTRIENFIQTHESKFSLFGWFFRLFNRNNE